MLLEYENINEKIYVNTVYEIFDENNNSLYIFQELIIMIINIFQIKLL